MTIDYYKNKMTKTYILGKYTRVSLRNNDGVFGAGSNQHIIEDKNLWKSLVTTAAQWIKPETKDSVYNKISHLQSRIEFDNNFNFLRKNNFLVHAHTSDSIIHSRYSRNHLHYQSYGEDPLEIQKNLSNKCVVVLGCGGIGNHVGAMLSTSGVGEIILVDNDIVEVTNLTRQVLFTEEDVGCSKTQVLRRELLRRNSETKVSELGVMIKNEHDLEKIPSAALWVVSADDPSDLIHWVNRYCVKKHQPYINAGYVNDIAVCGPLYIPGETGCYECKPLGGLPADDVDNIREFSRMINRNFKAATYPPVNAISAALCVNDTLKFLGGYEEPLAKNRKLGVWSDKFFSEERSLKKDPLCSTCGTS